MREDWEEIEFGKLCAFSQGIQVPIKEQYSEENEERVRFLRIIDFTQGNEPSRYVKKIEGNHLVSKDDISMVRYGTVGFVCTGKTGAIANNLFRIIPSNGIQKKYLIHFLKSSVFRQYLNAKGATMQALSFALINPIQIPLAPLPIQRAIVSKIETLFSDLDNGIANLKKAQDQLKIYRQAVLEQGLTGVFTKKFRSENPYLEKTQDLYRKIQAEIDISYKNACKVAKENGRRKPKDQRKNKKAVNVTSYLPETPWSYYRLEDLTYLVTDGTHFTPKYQEKGVKFLSVKNVRPFRIKDDKIKYISEDEHKKLIERCKPENGDILYTKVGTYGYASKIKLDYEFSIFVSLCLIKPVYKYFLTEYLEYLMNSEIVFRQARQRVSGSGVPDLHLVEIRDFKIPLPSVEEQRIIIQEIESRLSVCDKVEQTIKESLEKAESLRQSILKKAFEGKLLSKAEIEQCKEASDYEPASELLTRIEHSRNEKIKADASTRSARGKLSKEQALRQAQGDKKKKSTTKKKSKK